MRKFRAIIFHLYTTRFQSYINQWNNEVSQIPELKKFQNPQKSTCESYHNYEDLFHNILGHWSHVGVDITWMRTGLAGRVYRTNDFSTEFKVHYARFFLWRRYLDLEILNFPIFLRIFCLHFKYLSHSNARLLFRLDKIFKIRDHMLRIRLSFKTFFGFPLYSKLFWIKDTFPERMSLTERDTPNRLELKDSHLLVCYPAQ